MELRNFENEILWTLSGKDFSNIYHNNDLIYCNLPESKKILLFDAKTGNQYQSVQNLTLRGKPNKKNKGIVDNWLDTNRKLSLFDFEKNELVWTNNLRAGGNTYFSDNLLIVKPFPKTDLILSISLLDGSNIWSYQLPLKYNWQDSFGENFKGKFFRLIGIYNNTLWCVLNSGVILGLCTENGKVKFELCHPTHYPSEYRIEPGFERVNTYNRNAVIDGSTMFGMQGYCYWEIDLENPLDSFRSYNIENSCKTHNISLNIIAGWNNSEIYFYEGGDSNRFGMLSRIRNEIIWSDEIFEVKGEFPAIRYMNYKNGLIFLQDKNKVLHVIDPLNM
ncbi:MAG: hypothetical protein AAGI07_07000 [Bacteroidota bacterium]